MWTNHRTYIRLDKEIHKSLRKKLNGLLLVSFTTLTLHNYLLFCTKLQPFSKTLEECQQISKTPTKDKSTDKHIQANKYSTELLHLA